MAYVGKAPLTGAYQVLDNIASGFNASTVAFNLTVSGTAVSPGTEANCIISISGVVQDPSAYTISGNHRLHFHRPPHRQILFLELFLGDTFDIGTPTDATVTAGSLVINFFREKFTNME